MNTRTAFQYLNRIGRACALLLTVAGLPVSTAAEHSAEPEVVWLRTTNYAPRYLTNLMTISIATNVIREEYRTNWIQKEIRNLVDVYQTNYRTTFVTNLVPVDVFRTNIQVAYSTNLKTFNLTNWETVLVLQTNYLNLPVTNTVQIDIPAPTRSAAPADVATTTSSEPTPAPGTVTSIAATAPESLGRMNFELTYTARAASATQYPIRVVLKLADSDDILPVSEWRLEKVDGGAFMVGSRSEFTGQVAAGRYRVTARLHGADNSAHSVHCELEISAKGSSRRSPAVARTGQ